MKNHLNQRPTKDSNDIYLVGELIGSPLQLSTNIYKHTIAVPRNYNEARFDIIPITIHKKLLDSVKYKKIIVSGNIATRQLSDVSAAKKTSLYIKAISLGDGENTDISNSVYITGKIVSGPEFRMTPKGCFISELSVKVNNTLIFCIAWGETAKNMNIFNVGDYVEISGELQSREYIKNYKSIITYEICIHDIHKIDG